MKKPFDFMLMWLVILKTIDVSSFNLALILDKNNISRAKRISTFDESKKNFDGGKSWCSSKHSMMCAMKDKIRGAFQIWCLVDESSKYIKDEDCHCINKKENSTQFMDNNTFWMLSAVEEFAKPTGSCFIQQYTDQKDKITTKYFNFNFGSVLDESSIENNEQHLLRTEANYNGFTFYKLNCLDDYEQSEQEANKSEKEFKEIKIKLTETKNENEEEKTGDKKDKENNDNKEKSKEKKDEYKSSTLVYIVVIFILIIIILLLIIAYLAGRYCCEEIQVSDDFDYYEDEVEAHLPYEPTTNEFQHEHNDQSNSTHDLFTDETTENHPKKHSVSSSLMF